MTTVADSAALLTPGTNGGLRCCGRISVQR